MSWKLEVHGKGDPAGLFTSNALRFATATEAEKYGKYDLGSRWFGFDDSRVVESTDPVTYKFDEDSRSAIPVDDDDSIVTDENEVETSSDDDKDHQDWEDDDYEVDVVASGYEWECPKCGKLNGQIEYTHHVTCQECDTTFTAAPPEHAME